MNHLLLWLCTCSVKLRRFDGRIALSTLVANSECAELGALKDTVPSPSASFSNSSRPCIDSDWSGSN